MHSSMLYCVAIGLASPVLAFMPSGGLRLPMSSSPPSRTFANSVQPTCMMSLGGQTRGEVLQTLWKAALTTGTVQGLLASPAFAGETLVTESGLRINKLVEGKGAACVVGDLAGVRFKGNFGSYEFDNVFNTPEPYYTRVGAGTLVKGMDEAISMMHLGDKWELTCNADLAFGNQGRPPSPGRPRIPPGAEVKFVVEVVSLPGKEDELLEEAGEISAKGSAFDSVDL